MLITLVENLERLQFRIGWTHRTAAFDLVGRCAVAAVCVTGQLAALNLIAPRLTGAEHSAWSSRAEGAAAELRIFRRRFLDLEQQVAVYDSREAAPLKKWECVSSEGLRVSVTISAAVNKTVAEMRRRLVTICRLLASFEEELESSAIDDPSLHHPQRVLRQLLCSSAGREVRS